ncbi:hypothetical protein [Nocardioides sp. SLBN-35]|uniref:hypothetical protein n=1 Tax=Nocardioides sp. SLBN-35 TaxID=2768445 RepID=UPI001154E4B3|nr:hypothetical protein [Nocardioides sp. SLBN-35]TQK73355.1 hypothetical protein FBY23_5187 [Nocardioides sp. SLBN-35]
MYREAKALKTLHDEIDAAAPHRSTASDGWIGDDAHATRESDHNPWVEDTKGIGVVRARDFTHDPAGGLDCNELARRLVALMVKGTHPALRSGAYVIWNGAIFSYDRRTEGWRVYRGANPHTKHLHLSVATAAYGYDSTAPWGVMALLQLPKRAIRFLAEAKREVQRLRTARAAAIAHGENPEPYTTAIRKTRAARRAAKRAAKR